MTDKLKQCDCIRCFLATAFLRLLESVTTFGLLCLLFATWESQRRKTNEIISKTLFIHRKISIGLMNQFLTGLTLPSHLWQTSTSQHTAFRIMLRQYDNTALKLLQTGTECSVLKRCFNYQFLKLQTLTVKVSVLMGWSQWNFWSYVSN